MIMKKVCVVGHFAKGKDLLNGQTIKTKIVTRELDRVYRAEQVLRIDTHGGIKTYLLLPLKILWALCSCENIIICPAHNGVRIIAPILTLLNKPFKRKLHYVVIGGWLPDMIKTKKSLGQILRQFKAIYVETTTMKNNLDSQEFKNVIVMPNFKDIHILEENELIYPSSTPHKLCTFSRVMKEKGIEDAVRTITQINENKGQTLFSLDIYGQIEEGQEEWFNNLRSSFPEYIKYRGVAAFDKSVETIKEYYALLFPTHFYTEGIPGTIIDAYAAGVPVICSEWESVFDIVDNYKTGLTYDFYDDNGLMKILSNLLSDSDIITRMKINCITKAREYLPDKIIYVLCENL